MTRMKMVSTHKTIVSREYQVDPSACETSFVNRCPLHKANHSLKKCEAFRNRRLDKQRAF